ncbi:MAG: hypothetical protein KBC36_01035 [Spirochaetia bacterium]|nr:hypothetical protein [Spirochaetia bacterium]
MKPFKVHAPFEPSGDFPAAVGGTIQPFPCKTPEGGCRFGVGAPEEAE